MGFPRQEYWSGLLFPSPGNLPNPRIEPVSLRAPALTGGFFTTSTTWEFSECKFCISFFNFIPECFILFDATVNDDVPFSLLVLLVWVFSIFISFNIDKDWLIVLFLPQNQLLFHWLYCSILLMYALIFIIYFINICFLIYVIYFIYFINYALIFIISMFSFISENTMALRGRESCPKKLTHIHVILSFTCKS